jgi:hypothetical protein
MCSKEYLTCELNWHAPVEHKQEKVKEEVLEPSARLKLFSLVVA